MEQMLRFYSYLNPGLALVLNGKTFRSSRAGSSTCSSERMSEPPIYPLVHLKGKDVEIAFTHVESYGEDHFSFVNGQHTTMGGTHQAAFRESIVKSRARPLQASSTTPRTSARGSSPRSR